MSLNRTSFGLALCLAASHVVLAPHAAFAEAKPATASATSTAVVATPNPAYIGQTVALTAVVTSSAGTPTGTVNFVYQGETIGSVSLTNGSGTFTAPTTGLPSGGYVVYADYLGNSGYAASTAAVQVSLGQSATSTTLTTTTPSVVPPANVSLTATVTRSNGSGAPTGSVTFSYSGGTLATVPLNASGVANFSTPTPGVPSGTYTLTASYSGDTADKSSSGSTTITAAGVTNVTVTVNPLANRHVISPLVYGTNFPPNAAYIKNTGQTFTRWAGDASTAYNWLTNNTNDDFDYYFLNVPFQGSGAPNDPLYATSQTYVSETAANGGTPAIAIGMLPWTAKDASSYSFSVAKYGAQCSTAAPYHPDAGDGEETNCSTYITANDPNDAYYPLLDAPGSDDAANSVYRSQWIQALAQNFGTGLHVYGMDNEPEIWQAVHHDIHPAGTSYEEMKTLFLTKPALVKQYDPQATILGIGSSGWYFYWNSEMYGTDKTAHAGLDYNPWLINEIYWNDKVTGTKTFDWYDLHAYPDGNETNYTQAQKQALALRVLRDFWDPTYVAEGSDINQQYVTYLQPNKTIPFRIPRMRALINSEYPGTPFTMSEWNAALAGETDFSTALVDVDAWGILGREKVYASSRWTASATTSPAYNSLLMYRNYDGQYHGFGTTSVEDTNNGNPDLFSSYAALNATGTQMTLMLVNKDPSNQAKVTVNLGGFSPTSFASYTLSQANPNRIVSSSTLPSSNVISLPPYTAQLLVLGGAMQQNPAAEWDLNPDTTMVPANGSVTLAPKILSGSSTVTLSNPQSDSGITVTLNSAKVTTAQQGQITVTAGSTQGFYHYTVTGTDASGVSQTQGGYIIVQNPAAQLTAIGTGQTAAAGSAVSLTAHLNPASSGGYASGASVFFTTSAGTLSTREATTDSSGDATVTLTLPSTPGTVTVTAEGQYGLGHPEVTFTETAQ